MLPHAQVVRAACGSALDRDSPCRFDRLLAPTASLVASADLAICHMEVPVTPPGKPVTGYPTFGAPVALASGIAATGWDSCSTASNHTIDKGTPGIDATLNAFDAVGLGHSGSARTAEEAASIPIVDVKGVRIAHLSYAYGLNGLQLPRNQPWRVNMISVHKILSDAAAARAAGAQLVLVSLHWGQEYQSAPTPQQRQVAAALMNSDLVDLIIGHHAHVVQPIERIHGHWVIFGLGNHLSAQVGGKHKPVATQDGLMVAATFTQRPDGSFVMADPELHPTWVHPTTRVVYVVEDALANPATASSMRPILQSSFNRTIRVASPRVDV